ncbi:MAG: hypothetical protein LBV18_02260 [Alistipes sp.]|jgi:hypothetical protein|nr:hypothetical protein [Alistipes sp.]
MNHFKTTLTALGATIFLASGFASCGKHDPTPPTPTTPAYVGTVTVATGTPMEFTLENATVEFAVAENAGNAETAETTAKEATAEIKMLGVKFAVAMPVTVDMTIPGVALTATAEGWSLSGDEIVPIAMGGPYPERIVTDLTGTATEQELSFSMTCKELPVSFTGARRGEAIR